MTAKPYEEKKYTQSDAVTKAQQALEAQQAAKPGEYASQYREQLSGALADLQNREGFQYDPGADPLYRQAEQNYLTKGRATMEDTMGKAAALTGGYGNSYAQTAGQQAYDGYLQELFQLAPQYRQQAFQQYQAEGDALLQRYDLLLNLEQQAYGRYQDAVNRYYADLDRLQSAYDTQRSYDYDRFTQEQAFDYGKYLDNLNHQYRLEQDKAEAERWQQQFAYQQERDRIADAQWQKQYEEDLRRYNQEWALQLEQAAARAAGRSSSGGTSAYQKTKTALEEGGYNSAEMLQLIRNSSLTNAQQDKLVEKYQKPKQTQEVQDASFKRKNDTSAYWSSR